jgi:hypothetical protein
MAMRENHLGNDGAIAGLISPLEVDPRASDDDQPDVGAVPFASAPDPLGLMPAGHGTHEE